VTRPRVTVTLTGRQARTLASFLALAVNVVAATRDRQALVAAHVRLANALRVSTKRKPREPSVWVVEMLNDVYRRIPARWEPCSDSAITREQAELRIAHCRERNCNKFRLAKYRSVSSAPRRSKGRKP
jgi:hypothetical protein